MGSCSGVSDIYVIVGLSALLVSTKRGNAKALTREASDRLAPRLNRNIKHITLIIRYAITGALWIDTIKFPCFVITKRCLIEPL